jgi:hypothetical protein
MLLSPTRHQPFTPQPQQRVGNGGETITQQWFKFMERQVQGQPRGPELTVAELWLKILLEEACKQYSTVNYILDPKWRRQLSRAYSVAFDTGDHPRDKLNHKILELDKQLAKKYGVDSVLSHIQNPYLLTTDNFMTIWDALCVKIAFLTPRCLKPDSSQANTTLPERLFAHMRKEAQKPTPLPNTSRGLLKLLQQEFNQKVLEHELNTKPLDQAELLYRKLGKIYTILMKLESFQFSNPESGLLNSVVPQLEVYIKALNINETKRGELSQTVTLIRGVILRSKGEYFKPNPKPKKTPVGWYV